MVGIWEFGNLPMHQWLIINRRGEKFFAPMPIIKRTVVWNLGIWEFTNIPMFIWEMVGAKCFRLDAGGDANDLDDSTAN